MKVKDLIKELQKYPQNNEVYFYSEDDDAYSTPIKVCCDSEDDIIVNCKYGGNDEQ